MIQKILHSGIYSISAAALLLGAAHFLSRVLGIVRDRLLAGHFGASRELDIYYAAFQIPDFLFMVFLLGAASAAVIPILTEIRHKNEQESREFIRELWTLFLFGSLFLSLFAIFFAPEIVSVITPGFDAAEQAQTVFLARIMMLSPILLGISSIVSSVIQSFRRFFVYALAPIMYNIGIIFGILFLLPSFGLSGLAIGVVLGAFFHFLIQIPVFIRLGYSLRPRIAGGTSYPIWYRIPISDRVFSVIKLSFPRIIALSMNNFMIIVFIAIASTLEEGSIAVFQFAYNLHFVPIGIFGLSFAVAAFPALSEYVIEKDTKRFLEAFWSAIRSILFWILPLAVFFFVLRAQIVRVALGSGQFDWADTRLTAALLALMVLAIIALSIAPFIVRAFYALGNTQKPLFVSVGTVVITILLTFPLVLMFSNVSNEGVRFLIHFLDIEDIGNRGVLGIGLALSIGMFLQLALLMRGVLAEARRRFQTNASVFFARHHRREVLKMAFAALIGGIASFWTLRIMVEYFVTLDTFVGVFSQGLVAGLAGFVVYWTLLYIWRNREASELIVAVKGILNSKLK